MLLVEQNLQVVRQLAHTVVVLSGGRVVHRGGAQEFLDDADLVNRLLGVATEGDHAAARGSGSPADASHRAAQEETS